MLCFSSSASGPNSFPIMRRSYNTNSKTVQVTDLQPEQRRVYDVLSHNYPDWQSQCIDLISDDLLLTGSASFFESPVSMDNLPTGTQWCWRQSNARVSVNLDVTTFATLTKLNTKKTIKSAPKPPSYKYWIVQIERPYQQHLWFLYCEKGMNSLPQKPALDCTPEVLTDLSFVESIMSEASVESIWAEYNETPFLSSQLFNDSLSYAF